MTTHLPRLADRSYHCQCGSPVFSGTATAELDAVQGQMRSQFQSAISFIADHPGIYWSEALNAQQKTFNVN